MVSVFFHWLMTSFKYVHVNMDSYVETRKHPYFAERNLVGSAPALTSLSQDEPLVTGTGGPRNRTRIRQVSRAPPHAELLSPSRRTTSLESRSRSPSPTPLPSSTSPPHLTQYYGTARLADRSRSPSPVTMARSGSSAVAMPPAVAARKPTTLDLTGSSLHTERHCRSTDPAFLMGGGSMPQVLPSPTIPKYTRSPGSINFPKLNPSPTRACATPPPSSLRSHPHHQPPEPHPASRLDHWHQIEPHHLHQKQATFFFAAALWRKYTALPWGSWQWCGHCCGRSHHRNKCAVM